ncbi:hypothetical protein JAAARDRAFT_126788 [Jaapia argillacea MUCL 33604]|uniref:EI24-domain-containing protein n=1 Tax=Jaapia argillacea MUCL 33604 TaxID=933084 RepID=A0A067QAB9_9AGAM|nr:hypothetical protein JAAARDRAFT_126788 [Jaapia argillacea MUCL 33604]
MSRRYPARPQSVHYPPTSPTVYSPRQSYPVFISFQDTLKLQLSWAWSGLVDAFRWDIVFRTVTSDAEIQANLLKSLMLNSLSLVSIYTFDLLLHPLVQGQQKWLHRNVGWFYQVLWLLPVVGVSFYLNSSWCTLIAKRTYTLQHGLRTAATTPQTYTGLLNALATSAYRIIMVATSVVVSFSLGYVPIVGPWLAFVFLCWVDAYYCFEFIWIARGLSLSNRVRHLEERWAFYFAFGLPTAALCMWGSSLANAALFALLFPAYIIMAMHAHPVPQDPYSPLPPSQTSETSTSPIFPSPYIPIRFPVFALVIWLNDWIVRALSLGSGGGLHGTAGKRGSIGGGSTRGRGWGEGVVESAEEGSAGDIEMEKFGRGGSKGGMGGVDAKRVRKGRRLD